MTKEEPDTDSIISRLRQEFIEAARDQLEDIDGKLIWLSSHLDEAEEALLDVRRNIHNIKGQGATFGFPMTGRVAHMLEDYLKNTDKVGDKNIGEIMSYLALMEDLIASGESIAQDDPQKLLADLPIGGQAKFTDQDIHPIKVLLVMPPGTQRKLVASELLSCGFQVMRAYDTVQALSIAMDMRPEIVFTNYEMVPFDGRELCDIFSVIDALKHVHIVLLTSADEKDEHLQDLPKNTSLVKKTKNFTEEIGELMIEWKVFG